MLQSNSYGSASREFPPSLTIDQSSGEFYVSSNTEIGFDAQQPIGGSDASLARFTSNGSRIWTRIFGTTQNDYVAAIEFDQVHKLICAGGSTDGSLSGFHTSGYDDAFVVAYTQDGKQQWLRQFGTEDDDDCCRF